MKNRMRILVFCLLASWMFGQLYAQTSVNTGGGQALGTSGSVSYSIGQLFYSSYSGSTGGISEGVQIPMEVYLVTHIGEPFDMGLDVSVFPNPVGDYLTLLIQGEGFIPGSSQGYVLLDMSGKAIHSGRIMEETTLVDMHAHPPGIYLLQVFVSGQRIAYFKVIKR